MQMAGIPLLPINDAAQALARSHSRHGLLAVSWNCRHIAIAEMIERLEAACLELGLLPPTLCMPEQLMGD